MGTAIVSCTQPPTSPSQTVSLPPTTTPITLPQETAVNRPENTPEPTIPVTATLTSTPPLPVTVYTIQPGDTLFAISNRFDVTIQEIAEANNLADDAIFVGQTLIIPEQATAETAVPPTDTPNATATASPEATSEGESEDGGTAVPPESLEPTGRLELTYPLSMIVEESGVITVEVIADPALAEIGEHAPHATGVIRIDASYDDGERAYYEQTIELFPLMAAELNAPAFDVFPSGGDNVRLPRAISTNFPAVWTWDIVATTPGQAQVITLNLYKEAGSEAGNPILTQSISRNISVSAKSRWSQLVDGLADNVLVLLGTGGPLGLLLGYFSYRLSKENAALKRQVTNQGRQAAPRQIPHVEASPSQLEE